MAQTQTGEGAGTNVLDVLDQREPTKFYWQLTLLAMPGRVPVRLRHVEHRRGAELRARTT